MAHPNPNDKLNDSNDNTQKNANSHSSDMKNNSPPLLEVGSVPHHEIENFYMKEEKIEQSCHPVSWSNCDATTFNVRRGPNYVDGQKAPSKKAIYKVFAMDAYKLDKKINKIFQHTNIENYIEKYNIYTNKYKYDRNKFPLPPIFIMNCMVPNYPPELMGGKSDGKGYQMIIYAHLSEEVVQEMRDYLDNKIEDLSPSIKLLSQFIHSDLMNSEIRNRFKVIARIMNSQYTDFGFLANRLVRRYNGRPFLARTSSTFYHNTGEFFAADIDAHVFGYPARQGISYVKNTIQTAIYDVGFVIEGHSNDQLPEQILACCRISKMGMDQTKPFPDKFIEIQNEINKKLNQKIKDSDEKNNNNDSNQNTSDDNKNNNNNDSNNNNDNNNNNPNNGTNSSSPPQNNNNNNNKNHLQNGSSVNKDSNEQKKKGYSGFTFMSSGKQKQKHKNNNK